MKKEEDSIVLKVRNEVVNKLNERFMSAIDIELKETPDLTVAEIFFSLYWLMYCKGIDEANKAGVNAYRMGAIAEVTGYE